jgi:hypothetical protein
VLRVPWVAFRAKLLEDLEQELEWLKRETTDVKQVKLMQAKVEELMAGPDVMSQDHW